MALATDVLRPEIYRAMEDVVGEEFISQEPAILDSYSFVWGNELLYDGEKFSPRPLAVALPGNTEEVQAIVRLCNQHGIRFRPHASGFEITALSAPEGFLPLDLRRMNRILEIDEKNMYAVVEPYVSQRNLMLEANKKGLRPNAFGAGGSTSMIATACCHAGIGSTNVSAGHGGQLALGVEWVLPDGEILRLGTLGSRCGWFNGDGPGPSLRGVMRGYMGANGGHGVITKAAIRLSPWYGPDKLSGRGAAPNFELEIPDNMKTFTLTWETNEGLFEAFRLIAEEGIAHALGRRGPFSAAAGVAGSTQELEAVWNSGIYQEKFSHGAVCVLDAASCGEMEYKEGVMRKILEETGGHIHPEFNDPMQANSRFGYAYIGLGCLRSTFRTGTFFSTPAADEAGDVVSRVKDEGVKIKNRAEKEGVILNDGDSTYVTPLNEGSIGVHCEVVSRYDPNDKKAVKRVTDWIGKMNQAMLDKKLAIGAMEGCFIYNNDIHELFGPECMNYDQWMKKIKMAFDPQNVGEASFYIVPDGSYQKD
jgi:glycolate oxidase